MKGISVAITNVLLAAALVSAQGPGPPKGMGKRIYNPQAEAMVKGTIEGSWKERAAE